MATENVSQLANDQVIETPSRGKVTFLFLAIETPNRGNASQ
nr:MAG TPA: hypothetical protein [Caudoviricetes sp.]